MSMKKLKTAALLTGLVLTALLCGCSQQPAKTEPPQLLEPAGVQSDMVSVCVGDISRTAVYEAWVTAYTQGLYFEIGGSVGEIYAYPGKWVEEGEVLLTIDQKELNRQAEALREEIEYTQQSNARSDAADELRIEKMEVELRQLQSSRADSTQIALKKNEIETAQAALRQTRQLREPELKRKREELSRLEAQLDKNAVTAPFEGRIVSMQPLTQGEKVQAYEEILLIADEERIMLVGEYVPQSVLESACRVYARIGNDEYELQAQQPDEKQQIAASLGGGSVKTQYLLAEGQQAEIGAYAAVCVVHEAAEDVPLIPTAALRGNASDYYVYVDADGVREYRSVRVGVMNDAFAQITQGLEEGEMVYAQD